MVVLIVDCNNKRGNMRNRAKIGKNLTCVHSKLDQSWRWGVRADGRPSGGWICSNTARGGLRLYQGWSPYRRRTATAANAQAATLEAGACCSTQVPCRVKAEFVAPPLGEGATLPGLAPMPTLPGRGGRRQPTTPGVAALGATTVEMEGSRDNLSGWASDAGIEWGEIFF